MPPLTWHRCWLTLGLAASVSCGGSAPPSVVAPTEPTRLPAPIMMSARCPNPVHPGDTAYAACVLDVAGGVASLVAASADLRQFGGPAEARLVPCPACGGMTFDLDVRVPADMPLGPQTIPFSVTDAGGRRADTTALLQVAAR